MRIRANVAVDFLGIAELQKTREVYLLPGGMTGTDRLSYPLRLIGTAYAWLFYRRGSRNIRNGGPIDYPMGIYQNLGHTKLVAN